MQACVELSGDDKSTRKMSGTYHPTHAHASHGCNPQLRVLVAFSGMAAMGALPPVRLAPHVCESDTSAALARTVTHKHNMRALEI